MDKPHTPQPVRTPRRIEHPSLLVELVRCAVPDLTLLADFCDGVLGRDYFFKRRHLQSILERDTNAVYAVAVGGQMAGMVIVYRDAVLDNLYIAPEWREAGIGTAVLQAIRPLRIRSKTNMLAGDPTPFYAKNGYVVDQPDPTRPHILDMVRSAAEPISRPEPATTCGQAGPTAPLPIHAPATPAAVGVPALGSVAVASQAGVATPTPPAAPAGAAEGRTFLPSGHVVIPAEEYNRLETLRKGRERVAAYRKKRKAEQQPALAPAPHAAVTLPAEAKSGSDTFDPFNSNGFSHVTYSE